jgi:hypothetical protein
MSCEGPCKSTVSTKCITLIKDMYDNVMTSAWISGGDTDAFPVNIGLHQRSPWALIYLLWWWMRSQETYKVVPLGVCSLQMMWFWWMRVRRGLTISWNCEDKLWKQKVLGLVGLKQSTWSVISVLPHRRRRKMLDSMVRWLTKKDTFWYLRSML